MDMDLVKQAYADYKPLPNLGYKIIQYLMTCPEAEIIWKLLKYTDADAWKKPNLSKKEKAKMIYDGMTDQESCNVFLDSFMDESTNQEKSFLRIYPSYIFPTTRTHGICCIDFGVYIHSQINHLSNYTTRLDTIIQALIEVLNGRDVGGVGVLYFDYNITSYNHVVITGEKPYNGKILTMGVNLA